MSILVDTETRVIFQGMTGNFGRYHSQLMLDYGTKIVAGVTPGRGGSEVNGVPVYDSIEDALAENAADTVISMVPAPFVKEALFEAIDAGVRLIACLVEGVPVRDMLLVKAKLAGRRCTLLGPNSPGIISPGKALLGYMPGHIYRPGRVGVVSRSGTFSYPIAQSLSLVGLGQSTCVGIGGDPVTGVSFVDVLELFQRDPQTDVVVLVGEIGRNSEEEAAEYIESKMTKPVIAIILGEFAPPGKQMGHAGAIITAGRGTYPSKVRALAKAGVPVARTPDEVAELVGEALS